MQLARKHQSSKTIDKVFAEPPPQLGVVYQEWFSTISLRRVAAVDPSLIVERRTAAGDQGMDVGVVIQPLIPCMQDKLRCWLKLSCSTESLVKGSPSCLKQQIVQRLAITQNQTRQSIGQRKDNLEVVDLRQYQLLGLLQPVRSPSTTTLRTVAIDA
jgi:hypothetical protein